MQALQSFWNSISPYFAPQAQQSVELPQSANTESDTVNKTTTFDPEQFFNSLPPISNEEEIFETPQNVEVDPAITQAQENLINEIEKLDDADKAELSEHLTLLKIEAETHLANKIKDKYNAVKQTNEKQNELNNVYRELIAHMDQDGGHLEAPKEHKIHEHFKKARKHGITIEENKESFTKGDVDKIIKQVESMTKGLDSEFKLQYQEITECTKLHDIVLQTLKSCLDKLRDVGSKMMQGTR